MRSRFFIALALGIEFVVFAGAAFAQAPHLVNYQGKLAVDGDAASGSYEMTFAIYAAATGGSPLWNESQTVTVTNGVFNVLLGSVTPFPPDLFTGTGDRFLGIKVGSDPEMTPRFRLTSVPYAIQAARADTAGVALSAPNAGDRHSLDAVDGNPKDVVFVDKEGKVGIGTTSPFTKLSVWSASSSTSLSSLNKYVSIVVTNNSTTNNNFSALSFHTQSSNQGFFEGAKIAGVFTNHNVSALRGDLVFMTREPQNIFERMRITSGGDVGIATKSPLARLHVQRAVSNFATLSNHVAIIENNSTDTNLGPDVLAVKTSAINPDGATNLITFFQGDDSEIGRIEGNGSGGVSYVTTGGDYAEALPRLDPEEPIEKGDIVGVFAGKVTRRTTGAQHLLVISSRPAVLGNQPPEEQESEYENVAFLGQVEVKVRGPVRAGDFILASGENDGTGIAVPPEAIRTEHLTRLVGRAWETSEQPAVKMVNCAVGFPLTDAIVYAQWNQRRKAKARGALDQAVGSQSSTAGQPETLNGMAPDEIVSALLEAIKTQQAQIQALQEQIDAIAQRQRRVPAGWHAEVQEMPRETKIWGK
jgi:hypothetical protein